MKKIYTVFLLLIFASQLYAQAPNFLNYQGVVRDASGIVLPNQNISLRFTVHQVTAGGAIVYQETQSATTNLLGLFTVSIGSGAVVSGNFATIGWGTNAEYLQVEMDPTGGSSYLNMGTNQFLSVPYALNSGSSTGTAGGDLTGNYPNPTLANIQGVGVSASTPSSGQVLGYNGTNWVPTTPTLASALFANQGTTTTVLHGNVSGNPSWGPVNQATDVTGVLGYANGGTGLSTVGANGTVLTISSGVPAWAAPVTSGTAWQLTGNSVSGSTANTLGTINDFPLKLEINGASAGTIDPQNGANANTYIGAAAPNNGYGGAGNNDGGGYSVGIGLAALSSATTGAGYNVAVGNFALDVATTGSNSTAIGGLSQRYTTTSAGSNTSVGCQSMYNNVIGRSNTAVGTSALYNNTASANVAVGDSALATNTSALQNTAVGYQALASSSSPYNTAVGFQALSGETSGAGYNTAVGGLALTAAATGNQNVAVGYQALKANTTNGNTAIGTDALIANAIGTGNAAGGYAAAFGQGGSNNTAFGADALLGAAGTGSGAITGTGGGNTAIGSGALQLNNSGTNNTALGFGATVTTDGLNNATAIGANATVSSSNTVVLGHAANVQFSLALMPNGLSGNSGQVLQSNGSNNPPIWVTPAGTVGTAGGVNYGTGTGSAYTPSGSTGMVLVSNGTGGPQWENVTAIGATGDNWGNEVAVNDSFETNGVSNSINGNGTALHPLKIVPGTTSGQVLSWNGTTWAPAAAATSGWGLNGNAVSYTFNAAPATYLGTTATNGAGFQFGITGVNAGRVESTNASTSLGYQSLNASTGIGNTAFGYQSMKANTTGIGNTAVGYQTLALNTGYGNTAMGYKALAATTGGGNTAFGAGALALNNVSVASGPNTAVGDSAMAQNVSGVKDVAVGWGAMAGNNGNGNQNVAVGYGAMEQESGAIQSVAIGLFALATNVPAGNSGFNTAIGSQALRNSSTAIDNVAVGANAAISTTGSNNVAMGFDAMDVANTGGSNVAIGEASCTTLTSGSSNTAVGTSTSVGAGNTGNVAIGNSASATGASNSTAIGANASVTASNSMALGGTGANAVSVGIGTATPNSILQVVGGVSFPLTTTAVSLTLTGAHHTVIITGGTPAITLPAATGNTGRMYVLVNETASPVTVSSYKDFTGTANTGIPANSSIIVQTDGTNWYQIR